MARKTILHLFAVLDLVVHVNSVVSKGSLFTLDSDMTDKILHTNKTAVYSDVDYATTCAQLCIRQSECTSFFFNEQRSICQNHGRRLCDVASASSEQGSRYFKTKGCPDGFHACGDSCYFVSTTKEFWADAMTQCEAMGAKLAIITDSSEDMAVVDLIKRVPDPYTMGYWLGGFYDTLESQWMWHDGTHVTYSRYGPGEPNRISVEHSLCLVDPRFRFIDYQWGNLLDSENRYICERDVSQ